MNETVNRRHAAVTEYLNNPTEAGWQNLLSKIMNDLGGVRTVLREKSVEHLPGRDIPVNITCDGNFLSIAPEGYGEMTANNGEGAPVLMELYENELRVIVFDDINSETPKTINLENAQEVNRTNDEEVITLELADTE